MENEDFKLDISPRIEDFKYYLHSHPRVIFSARFGDGKSYFLRHFQDTDDIKKEYIILTLHPVNYQVLDNKDIFEMIKRDLLFQLIYNNMIKDDMAIADSWAYYLAIRSHASSILEWVAGSMSLLGYPEQIETAVLTYIKASKLFSKIRDKVKELRNPKEHLLDSFFDETSKVIFDNDPITKLIRSSIASCQNDGKKVALVIEDMDRLDPAHLFRIMNVFAAHMDYVYYDFRKPDESVMDNKFGVDNVIFVMDIDNTRRIYQHFYGENTNFQGYIDKFCSSGYFRYSLQEEKAKKTYEYITRSISVDRDVLEQYLNVEEVSSETIRKIKNAVKNPEAQIKPIGQDYSFKGESFPITILLLFVILERLQMSKEDIINKTESILNTDSEILLPYIAGYLEKISKSQITYKMKDTGKVAIGVHITGIYNGKFQYNRFSAMDAANDKSTAGYIEPLLNFIS